MDDGLTDRNFRCHPHPSRCFLHPSSDASFGRSNPNDTKMSSSHLLRRGWVQSRPSWGGRTERWMSEWMDEQMKEWMIDAWIDGGTDDCLIGWMKEYGRKEKGEEIFIPFPPSLAHRRTPCEIPSLQDLHLLRPERAYSARNPVELMDSFLLRFLSFSQNSVWTGRGWFEVTDRPWTRTCIAIHSSSGTKKKRKEKKKNHQWHRWRRNVSSLCLRDHGITHPNNNGEKRRGETSLCPVVPSGVPVHFWRGLSQSSDTLSKFCVNEMVCQL